MAKSPTSQKSAVPSPLYVHIDRIDGCHLVGELRIQSSDPTIQGGFLTRFQYADEWLRNGFPLDPINLPLKSQWVETQSRYIKLGVIFDAAPDLWGRRVIEATGNFPPSDERQVLLMGRGNGVGALLFSDKPELPQDCLPAIDSLPLLHRDIGSLHEAVHQVCLKTDVGPSQATNWLAGSWSMGGARAKAVVRDDEGHICIAKFSEPHDKYDRQRIEYANLLMAKDVGIQVPSCKVIDTALGSVFVIDRFDRPNGLHRKHYLSAISLVSAEPESKRFESVRDQMIFSYARIAHIAAKISTRPQNDVVEIYARMLLNVCVKNTDDHMKNIGFIESPQGGGTLQLSPLFDVVTQAGEGLHYLRIGTEGRLGTIENALSEPDRFGLKRGVAEKIAGRVKEVVAERDYYYRLAGLDPKTMADVNQLLEARCPKNSSTQSPQETALRLAGLPGLQAGAGAAYTLWQVATLALEEHQGDALKVDWRKVEEATIRISIGEKGQAPEAVSRVLCAHSPGATGPADAKRITALIDRMAPGLVRQFEDGAKQIVEPESP